jgi:tRNA-splicing ligase RtcB (3'-phosphate/5'-hydroxy nucleic acid ligase)
MKRVVTDTKTPIKIWASDLEHSAEEQVRNVASLPFLHSHVALMPDAHAGKGSTVGTVIATAGAILPAAVGVDLGCGMAALKLPFKVDALKDLPRLRHSIERSIPTGRDGNRDVSDRAGRALKALGLPPSFAQENRIYRNAALQFGSLGGGNHFIEICADRDSGAWIMLHSGSRNIGKMLAEKHIEGAKGIMKKRMIELPDPDLAYFTEEMPEFEAYIKDMLWAQAFARENRHEMLLRILKDVSHHVFGDARILGEADQCLCVNCHHNYCQKEEHLGKEVWVTRKGAVSAKAGELGIIPGSMGAKSFIVKGKGNPDSFESCSHGAGRRMSRTEAKRRFTVEDLQAETKGIECRKDRAVVDEIPSAYKNIDEVMANQADLVEPVFELRQLLCIKGD